MTTTYTIAIPAIVIGDLGELSTPIVVVDLGEFQIPSSSKIVVGDLSEL